MAAGATADKPKVTRALTEAMVAAARAKMKRDGMKSAPKGLMDDFEICRSFLGPLKDISDGPAMASDKQLGLIRSLVTKGHSPPEGAGSGLTMAAASKWINGVLSKRAVAN